MGLAGNLLRAAWRRVDRFLSVVDVNPEPQVLHSFAGARSLAGWRVFSDANFGGLSHADLTATDDGQAATFSGHYSRELPDNCTLVRAGYCGMNFVRPRNLNLQHYDYLDFRLRGDGHTYITSVRLDQYTGGDEEAWQAPIHTRPGGEMQTVRVEFKDFIFSFRGRVVTNQGVFVRMPQHNIMALGITLAASEDMPVAGDFSLDLERITAGAHPVQGDAASLKTFQGFANTEDDAARAGYGRHSPSSSASASPAQAGVQLADERAGLGAGASGTGATLRPSHDSDSSRDNSSHTRGGSAAAEASSTGSEHSSNTSTSSADPSAKGGSNALN